jgi:hypothetical protein
MKSLVCDLCQKANYEYRAFGKCIYTLYSRESSPGPKTPDCPEIKKENNDAAHDIC